MSIIIPIKIGLWLKLTVLYDNIYVICMIICEFHSIKLCNYYFFLSCKLVIFYQNLILKNRDRGIKFNF